MRKINFILSFLLISWIAFAQKVPLFTEQFLEEGAFDAWTNVPTPEDGNLWELAGPANGAGHGDGYGVSIFTHTTINNDAWIYSPGISLEADRTYDLSFWIRIPNNNGRLEVKLGTAQNSESMTETAYEYGDGNDAIGSYTQQTYAFTPSTTGTYYIGFHSTSPYKEGADATVDVVFFDDIKLEGLVSYNLSVIPDFPYTYAQVPISQNVISAKAVNRGISAQSNIVFSATVNESPAQSATPIASLAPNDTTELLTITNAPFVLGADTIIYTVNSGNEDGLPSDNTVKYGFTGTQMVYATENETATSSMSTLYDWGNTVGNIYKIVNQATATGITVGLTSYGSDFFKDLTFSLYAVNENLTIDEEPIASLSFTRQDRSGFYTYAFPEPVDLPVGNYFLAFEGVTTDKSCGMHYKSSSVAKIYKKGVNNQLEINTTSGQLALRLLLQSESCDVVPSGLTAVPANYSADLAWESDGDPYQYEVSLSYNDESHTYTTYDKNITINNLPNGVTFSWSVRALCDPLQGGESVAGPDFTTVLCDAFTSEGFNGETFPPSDCWISSSTDNSPWKQVTTGTNPNCTPQEGSGMLQYFCYSYSPGKKGLLILPPVSVEANVNTVKEFSFYMYRDAGYSNNIDCVNIYISPVPDITGLSPYLTVYRSLIKSPVEAEEGWYQYKILLPPLDNGTAHIAIEGVSGYGNNIYVDNLTVTEIPHFADAGVTAITSLPAIGVNLTNAEPVTIQVKNRGSQSISDLPVKYEVNGVVVGDEIIAGPIASASEIEYTFDTPADLSEDGEYIIKAYTALTGDADANNDTITFALRNYSCAPIATFPWSESFDAWEGYSAVFPPTPCWTSTSNRQGNVDRPWIQVKTGVFPTCSPQGGEEDLGMLQYKCYNYSTGSKGTLRTPLIAGKGKVLEFSFWMYRENESPYGGPEYKDSVNIYAVSSDTALVKTVYRNKTLEPVETGEDGWYQYKVNLSPESDIYIDIEGVSNYGNNIYLDNIALDFLFGVVSTNIEEGETGVTVDQNVEITFNKAIEVSNPEGITIRKNSDNSLVSGIVSIVSDDGKSLSISHDALEYGATYTVTIPGGTISEAVEEGEEGLTLENDFTLSFTAEPLNITATIPASEATDVSVLQGIEVEFDKPISIVVNAHDKVTLTGGGQTFTFTNGVTVSDNKLLITHESTPFIHNTEYTISIEAGAVVGYNQDTTWTFTSIAAPVPTYTPEEDAENVALDAEVAVEFDRAPLHVSGTGVSDPITITDEEGNLVENVAGSYPATGEEEDENKKISITHDDFAYNTTYTVNIPVGKLIDAADYTTPITWSFTTKKAAIAVEDKTPTGENIAIDATVSITFDENVAINGTPDLSGISIAGGAAGISASYEDNVITIAHDLFEFETTYTVNVPVGSVIGCDEVITWSFKTVKDVAIQTPSVGKAIQVYPTVTKGMIKVYTLENATITITDISGRVLAIHKSEGDVKDIDLHYSNGIYFVTVESGKAVSTHKVVLEK